MSPTVDPRDPIWATQLATGPAWRLALEKIAERSGATSLLAERVKERFFNQCKAAREPAVLSLLVEDEVVRWEVREGVVPSHIQKELQEDLDLAVALGLEGPLVSAASAGPVLFGPPRRRPSM